MHEDPRVSDASDVLTVAEAAQLCRVSADTIYELVARGKLPAARVGRQIRIPHEALLAHLNRTAEEAMRP